MPSKKRFIFIFFAIVAIIIAGYFVFKNKAEPDLGIDGLGNEEGGYSTIIEEEETKYVGLKVEPLVLENQSIEFPHTDDNEGESLIIKSDKKLYYSNNARSDVYISITNTSNMDQEAALLFYFPGDQKAEPILLERFNDNSWDYLTFYKNNIKINRNLLDIAVKKRESIPESTVPKATAQINIPAGRTVYFKSLIAYDHGTRGEFWVEALGDKGSYGLLDPLYSSIEIRGGVKLSGKVEFNKIPVPAVAGGAGSACANTKIDDASNFGAMPNSGRTIVRTSNGDLYAFIKATACEVWKSTDGSSWSEVDSADSPTCTGAHAIAVDSADKLHIVYENGVNFLYNTITSDAYGTSETVFATLSVPELADIAIDSAGKPHVVLTDNDGGDPLLTLRVRYTNRVSGSWKTPVIIESHTNVTSFTSISIVISEDNLPEISYIDVSDGNLAAVVGDANDATSFGTPYDIDTTVNTTAGQRGSSIAIDSSGNTWIAYVDLTGTNQITLVEHLETQSDWTIWETPVTNLNVGNEPSIAINGSDIYVFYEDSADDDIKYDRYNGSWLGETLLETGTFQDTKAKWAYYNNNEGSTRIDYLYSDATDIYCNSLSL